MPISTVIDPAHGGAARAGRSTPFGALGVTGLVEKDVTLGLARRLAANLQGEARLTRDTDVNVTLRERAGAARRFGARAFVSVHAAAGDPASTTVWIHTRGSQRSRALAESVAREMARFGARIRRADMAVLHPAEHDPQHGACLVEVGGLGHAEGERRLRDAGHLDALAQAMARGVRGFLGGQPVYGRAPLRARVLDLDLTDFDERQFYVYPDADVAGYPARVSRTELDDVKAGWDRMMRGVAVALDGTEANKRAFRQLLAECMVTSKVVRDAFLFVARDDGSPTLTLEVGSSIRDVAIDGFEFAGNRTPQVAMRGHHTIDLHDFGVLPRVSTTAHHGMITKSEVLIHALVEAAEGVRSAIVNGVLRYRASHAAAVAEENRYRTEQGMPGARVTDPQGWGTATAFLHLTDTAGNDVSVETWHFDPPAFDDLVSIDYA